MATYSLSITAAGARNIWAPKLLTLDDAYATPGGEAGAMSDGTVITCKKPDGSTGNYKIDAERSDPARNLIYLLKQ